MKFLFFVFFYCIFSFNAMASDWEKMPGAARDVGNGWVIGMTPVSGGYGIFRWDGFKWEKMPGGGVRIGGSKNKPWVVNNENEIYRWSSFKWEKMPGAARDIGDGWMIGTTPASGGYEIYRWRGFEWKKMPGAGIRIGGSWHTPWVVNDENEIYRWAGSDWEKMPGEARDVGEGWIIGMAPASGGYEIFRWHRSKWEQVSGAGVNIGGASFWPWVVNDNNEIYRK